MQIFPTLEQQSFYDMLRDNNGGLVPIPCSFAISGDVAQAITDSFNTDNLSDFLVELFKAYFRGTDTAPTRINEQYIAGRLVRFETTVPGQTIAGNVKTQFYTGTIYVDIRLCNITAATTTGSLTISSVGVSPLKFATNTADVDSVRIWNLIRAFQALNFSVRATVDTIFATYGGYLISALNRQ